MFRQQTVYICEHESWIVSTQGAQAVRYQYEVNDKWRPVRNNSLGQVADQHLSLKVHHPWQCFLFVLYAQDALLKLVHWKDLAVSVLAFRMFPIVPIPEMNRRAMNIMNSLWDVYGMGCEQQLFIFDLDLPSMRGPGMSSSAGQSSALTSGVGSGTPAVNQEQVGKQTKHGNTQNNSSICSLLVISAISILQMFEYV